MREIFKNKNLAVGVLILILGGIFIARTTLNQDGITKSENIEQIYPTQQEEQGKKIDTSPKVTIGKTVIPVEVRATQEELEKGLSGRTSLNPESGMIFLFKNPGKYKFWMPDMHFAIDIIWIDENKKIVGIHKDVSPEFDPENPEFFIAPKPAKYVLEVNSGFSEKNNIAIGNEVIFEYVEK